MSFVLLRVLPFFALVAAGAALARLRVIDQAGARGLSLYVYWLAFPALLFHALSHAPAPDLKDATVLAAYCAAMALAGFSAIALGRALGWTRQTRAGTGMAAIVANNAFLGMPLCVSVLGPAAQAPAALLVAADSILLMPLGLSFLYGAAPARGKSPLASLAQNPIVIAAIVGVAFAAIGWTAYEPLSGVFAMLAPTASPVGLIALGAVLTLELESAPVTRADLAPVAIAAALRTLLAPLLMFAAMHLMGAPPLQRAVAVLMAGSPTAVNVFIQTRAAGVFAMGAARVVALATAIAAVTLPLLAMLLAPT